MKLMKAGRLFLSLSVLLVSVGAQAQSAQVATTTLSVSATLAGACTEFSVSPIAFGTLFPSQTISTTGTVTVNCAAGVPFKVGFGAGQAKISQLGFAVRTMTNTAGNQLGYFLEHPGSASRQDYGDADCGAGSFPTPALSGTGTGSQQSLAFRAVTDGFVVSPTDALGDYTDTVTLTLCL